MLVGGLVHFVVTLGLEEEVTGLAARHRHQPADRRGRDRVREHQDISGQEAQRAHQVQGLVDAAVVVVAVVVPALRLQCLEKSLLHVASSVPVRA